MHSSSLARNCSPTFIETGYDGYNPTLESCIPSSKISSVLDVGCGRGGNAAGFARNGLIVDGVSWLPAELEAAKKYCRNVFQCDVNEGIPDIKDASYDCVICSHILEHIAYPDKLLSDIWRGLSPGGYVVVAIPNLFFWRDRLKLIAGIWRYEQSGTFDYTHLRWYTKDSLEDLLSAYGFVVDGFWADGWLPLPGLRFVVGSRIRSRLNKLACTLCPEIFGQQLLFRFRKSEKQKIS